MDATLTYTEFTFPHTEAVLKNMAEVMREFMRDKLSSNGTNASYELSNSINYRIDVDGHSLDVYIELADYWKYVENGTKPHWPPIDKIEEWIKVKPVLPEVRPVTYHWYTNGRKKGAPKTIYNERTVNRLPSVQQLAYLISRKISRVGTEAQPFFWNSVEEAVAQFESMIEDALSQDIEEQITAIIAPLQF